eukprot:14608044-Alexandrium_andersonii.AAC.1
MLASTPSTTEAPMASASRSRDSPCLLQEATLEASTWRAWPADAGQVARGGRSRQGSSSAG